MGPIELIQQHYDEFTNAEAKVADFVLQNAGGAPLWSISTLTEGSGTSNAAVIRMCRKIGYDGFSELKFSMNRYLLSQGGQEGEEEFESDPLRKMLDAYIKYINLLPSMISKKELARFARSIMDAKRISIWGVNRTAQSAKQLSNRLTRLGIYNKCTEDFIIMNDDANILGKGDLCILLSLNGRGNHQYPQLLANLQNNGCQTVLITMNPKLPMAKNANQTFVLPWVSHDPTANFFEDQIIVYLFIEMLLYTLVNTDQRQPDEHKIG